jgi:hypothetical protein
VSNRVQVPGLSCRVEPVDVEVDLVVPRKVLNTSVIAEVM